MDYPNVLLIVMDTARGKNACPATNNQTVPNLNKIGSEGIIFQNAMTTGPWTLPSHASIFTGQYTSTHQAHAGTEEFSPTVPPLAKLLNKAGYQTVAISNNSWISPEVGFGKGFDDFYTGWYPIPGGGDLSHIDENSNIYSKITELLKTSVKSNFAPTIINAIYATYLRHLYDHGALVTNWRIKRWLNQNQEQPFFMFVNYVEPHLDYDPPKRFRESFVPNDLTSSVDEIPQNPWEYITGQIDLTQEDFDGLEGLYDAEINYLDYRIGKIYEYLDRNGMLDETLIIICGDHGENIGEHQLMDHQYCLYDTLINVPLVMRYPHKIESGIVNDSLVELRDIFPTILELTDVTMVENDSVSTQTLPLSNSEIEGRDYTISEYLYPQPSMKSLEKKTGANVSDINLDRALRSIRTSEWKLIIGSDNSKELYNMRDDPNEINDVSDSNPKIVENMRDILSQQFGSLEVAEPDKAEIQKETKKRLEKLGYL